MGYTHYFTFKPIKRGDADKVDRAFKLAIKNCAKIAKYWNTICDPHARLSGYTAHTRPGRYGGVQINGKGSDACEDFFIQEKYQDNVQFNFCKTRGLPYDSVVTACLAVFKHRLKEYIEVSSDGTADDWDEGVNLANTALKLVSIKNPFKPKALKLVNTRTTNSYDEIYELCSELVTLRDSNRIYVPINSDTSRVLQVLDSIEDWVDAHSKREAQ